MKDKRRRLPRAIGPLETLDERVVPAGAVVPIPTPAPLFGPFVPGQPVEIPNPTVQSGMLRGAPFLRAPAANTALVPIATQNSMFHVQSARLITSPLRPGAAFGTVPFGVGGSLLVNVNRPSFGGVRAAVGANGLGARAAGAGAATFHGKVLVAFVNSDSGLRPFLPNFGASAASLANSSSLSPFLSLLSNNNNNVVNNNTTSNTTFGTTTFGAGAGFTPVVSTAPFGLPNMGFAVV